MAFGKRRAGAGYRPSGLSTISPNPRSFTELIAGFDEEEYLRCNPDVARAVRDGVCPSGLIHFAGWGIYEGRRGVCSEMRSQWAAIFESCDTSPNPPTDMIEYVGCGNPLMFNVVGRVITVDVHMALSTVRTPAKGDVVLDFGCGCGRVLRYLAGIHRGCRFFASDVDARAIEWCRRNLGAVAEFSVNQAVPPLPFDNDTFDFVIAISVFTHLPEVLEDAWLLELSRVTRRDGFLLLSIQAEELLGDDRSDPNMVIGEYGFHYSKEQDATEPGPYVDATYHSEEYVRAHWSRYFEIVDIGHRGIAGHQDWVLCCNSIGSTR